MKRKLWIMPAVLWIVAASLTAQTVYYVSSEGDDNNDGLSDLTAWASLEKASAAALQPGDSLLFRCGDSFSGRLIVNGSGIAGNPVVISSYGSGDKPIIDGATNVIGGAHLSAVYILNNDHIEMRGLEINNDRLISRTGVDDTDAFGIFVENNGDRRMHGLVFRELTISDVYSLNIDGLQHNDIHVSGILFQSRKNYQAGKEKNISDVLIEDCYISHLGKLGIWSRHEGGATGIGNDSLNRNMNFVIRNNHFFETGGSGVVLSKTYNGLLEYNTFEYPGSDYEPRMAKRGSAAWFWSSRNILAQYNKSLHVRGGGDSYSMHVDYGNRNIFFQYNYSEDTEGGFAEILGNNVNSVYRFNLSVNDGFRDYAGNSIWISDYAGAKKIVSDSSFIYNNTIYVSGDQTPDISINGKRSYIYNNIFQVAGNAVIGEQVSIKTADGGFLLLSNNLYDGDIRTAFTNYDLNPYYGDPVFTNAGALDTSGYKLGTGSAALGRGKSFNEPVFPGAGKGIFKDVPPYPVKDLYGNAVSIATEKPHIGAYNGEAVIQNVKDITGRQAGRDMVVFADPVSGRLKLSIKAFAYEDVEISIFDISGKRLFSAQGSLSQGINNLDYPLDPCRVKGIYLVRLKGWDYAISKKFILQ